MQIKNDFIVDLNGKNIRKSNQPSIVCPACRFEKYAVVSRAAKFTPLTPIVSVPKFNSILISLRISKKRNLHRRKICLLRSTGRCSGKTTVIRYRRFKFLTFPSLRLVLILSALIHFQTAYWATRLTPLPVRRSFFF